MKKSLYLVVLVLSVILLGVCDIYSAFAQEPETASPIYHELAINESKGWIYGSDFNRNKIDVIRISDLQIIKSFSLPAGAKPRGIALSPDGNELAVAQYGRNTIAFLNATTGELKATVKPSGADPSPFDVVYGRPGRLYSSGSSFHDWNGISIIDSSSHTLVGYSPAVIFGSAYLEISSDFNTIYSNDGADAFYKFDVSSDEIPQPSMTGAYHIRADQFILSPNEDQLFSSSGQVWRVDFKGQSGLAIEKNYSEQKYVVSIPNHDAVAYIIDDNIGSNDRIVFARANNYYWLSVYILPIQADLGPAVVLSDGSKLYVSTNKGMISVDLSAFPPGTAQSLPKGSSAYFDLAVDDTRQVLYGSNTTGHKIDIISMQTREIIGSIRFNNGASPKGIDISPNGNELAVALNGGSSIAFVNLNTKKFITLNPDTRLAPFEEYHNNHPYDVVYGREGRLYSTGSPYGVDYIHVIDTNSHKEISRSSFVIGNGPILAISSDKNTLYVNDDVNVSPQKIYKFDVTSDVLSVLDMSPHASLLNARKILLSTDDSKIFTDTGQVWDSSLAGTIGATNQSGVTALLPTQDAIAVAIDNDENDALIFFNSQNYYGQRRYELPALGIVGAMAVTSDGNQLFLSSESGVIRLDLSSGLPGVTIPLPKGSLPYFDMVIDETRGVLYGSDHIGHKIDVIDMSTLQVIKKYRLVNGAFPVGIDLSPDRSELAVAEYGASTIVFIDLNKESVIARVIPDVPDSLNVPWDVIYGRSGRLYSSGAPAALGTDYIHVFDTDTHTEISKSSYDVRSFPTLAISADNTKLFVNLTSLSPQKFLKFDITTDSLPIPLSSPHATWLSGNNFLLSPDGRKIFVDSGQVWSANLIGQIGSTGQAGSIALLPAYNAIAVASIGNVSFYRMSDYYGIKNYSLPELDTPGPMVASSNSRRLFISNSSGVLSINLASGLIGTPIPYPAGSLPYFDLVLDEARGVLYGSDPNGHKVDVISVDSLQVLKTFRLVNGSSPTGIALSPDGSELAIAQYGASSITFLNPETGNTIEKLIPNTGSLNKPWDVVYGRTGLLYSSGSPYSYGIDYIHVIDAITHLELGRSEVPVRSFPFLDISEDGNRLYVIETFQSPEFIYRYDVSSIIPVRTNSAQMNFSYAINSFILLKKQDKVITTTGQVWDSELNRRLGTFSPGGVLAELSSHNAFLSASKNQIWYFNQTDYMPVGTTILPGVEIIGAAVANSNDNEVFLSTDSGINKIDLSTFPPSILSLNVRSRGTYDGWVLESEENSSVGRTISESGSLRVGDDAANKQYRSILSFDTANIPIDALITRVMLRLKKEGITGDNPFDDHGRLIADISTGQFGARSLEKSDFEEKASKYNIGWFRVIPGMPDWYQIEIKLSNFQYINRSGLTQFRIRFSTDDNYDKDADFVSFYSGDTSVSVANRPILIIEYILP
jgi:DNA-binding beta-propeller fold protein YncE